MHAAKALDWSQDAFIGYVFFGCMPGHRTTRMNVQLLETRAKVIKPHKQVKLINPASAKKKRGNEIFF